MLKLRLFDKKRKARSILKGYRKLKANAALTQVNLLSKSLSETALYGDCKYSETFYFAASDIGELVTRQYLVQRLAGPALSRALLYAVGSEKGIVHPMPGKWLSHVEEHGFQVARVRSTILWYLTIINHFIYGLAGIFGQPFRVLANGSSGELPPVKYIYFYGLNKENLPVNKNEQGGTDLASWYVRKYSEANSFGCIAHSVKGPTPDTVLGLPMRFITSPVLPPGAGISIPGYACWAAKSAVLALFDMLRGRWWHSIMFMEAVKTCLVNLSRPQTLASRYVFNNSGWVYRPLWTYEAEHKGSEIALLFYSANIEGFRKPGPLNDSNHVYYGYRAMTWPVYIVWDQWQQKFIDKYVSSNHKCEISGSISFTRSSNDANLLNTLPEKYAVIFDVQPVRNYFYRSLAVEHDFYTPDVACRFIQDCVDVFEELGITVVLKRKRNIGRNIHQRYRRMLSDLSEDKRLFEVPPDVNLDSLIEQATAVVSMPFTSTALAARNHKKPSVYYDPVGFLEKNDTAAHEIPLLQKIHELQAWAGASMVHESTIPGACREDAG